MRKLVLVVIAGGLAWLFLGRRRTEAGERATIGYADGSAVTLEAGSPELYRLVRIAGEAAGEA